MRKLSRKETAQINGGLMPGQCLYTDPNTGKKIIGCRLQPVPDCCGGWVYPIPGHDCVSCTTGDL